MKGLVHLYLVRTLVTHLDAAGLTQLKTLDIRETRLLELDISGGTGIEVDAASLVKLVKLIASNSPLDTLNTEYLGSLKELRINGSNISKLDINQLLSLEILFFANCPIKSFNLLSFEKLKEV